MYFIIDIISIEPKIVDDPTLTIRSIINDVSDKNTASPIDLPVISTENGPFGLVNMMIIYVLVISVCVFSNTQPPLHSSDQ